MFIYYVNYPYLMNAGISLWHCASACVLGLLSIFHLFYLSFYVAPKQYKNL